MAKEEITPEGIGIVTFESGEDMLEWFASNEAEVQSRPLVPEQLAINYGSYAIRFWENLLIFLRVIPLDEQAEDTDTLYEIDYNNRTRNMLWCLCFSVVEPLGEYGSVHRSTLWPISERTWLLAKDALWDPERLPEWALQEIETARQSINAPR